MITVEWARIPSFIREAVEDFPFRTHPEAAEFFALLVARIRSRLRSLPSANGPRCTDRRSEWSWDLYAEMVSKFVWRRSGYLIEL